MNRTALSSTCLIVLFDLALRAQARQEFFRRGIVCPGTPHVVAFAKIINNEDKTKLLNNEQIKDRLAEARIDCSARATVAECQKLLDIRPARPARKYCLYLMSAARIQSDRSYIQIFQTQKEQPCLQTESLS